MSRASARVEKLKEIVEAKRSKRKVRQTRVNELENLSNELENLSNQFYKWKYALEKEGWCLVDEIVLASRWAVIYSDMPKFVAELNLPVKAFRKDPRRYDNHTYIMVPDWVRRATVLWRANYSEIMDLKTFIEKTNATQI
jgi:hypothetical protein